MVARLWAACGVPDFRKVGVEPHARFVARLFAHLSEGTGHIPHDWFAAEIARLDNVQGDVETLAGRIASARTWAYIAHRADWLADPVHRSAEHTSELQSLMRISYAVFCLTKKNNRQKHDRANHNTTTIMKLQR